MRDGSPASPGWVTQLDVTSWVVQPIRICVLQPAVPASDRNNGGGEGRHRSADGGLVDELDDTLDEVGDVVGGLLGSSGHGSGGSGSSGPGGGGSSGPGGGGSSGRAAAEGCSTTSGSESTPRQVEAGQRFLGSRHMFHMGGQSSSTRSTSMTPKP